CRAMTGGTIPGPNSKGPEAEPQKPTKPGIGIPHNTIRKSVVVYAYIALYIALDWISLIPSGEPGSLGITPWNPPAGLSFALLLRYGLSLVPAVLAAIVCSSVLFHGLPAAPLTILVAALIIALGYGAAAALLRSRPDFSLRMDNHSDLLRLLAVALTATMLVAISVVATFASSGLLAWDEAADMTLHFWVGDMI